MVFNRLRGLSDEGFKDPAKAKAFGAHIFADAHGGRLRARISFVAVNVFNRHVAAGDARFQKDQRLFLGRLPMPLGAFGSALGGINIRDMDIFKQDGLIRANRIMMR